MSFRNPTAAREQLEETMSARHSKPEPTLERTKARMRQALRLYMTAHDNQTERRLDGTKDCRCSCCQNARIALASISEAGNER